MNKPFLDRILDFFFPPEQYVLDVKNAHLKGLTYKPGKDGEKLPREMNKNDLYGAYYPEHCKQIVYLNERIKNAVH